MLAKMAIMAITTNNSIKVKQDCLIFILTLLWLIAQASKIH